MIAVYGYLYFHFRPRPAMQAGLQSFATAGYLHYLLRRHLRLNKKSPNQELLPALGPANWITLARGGLIAFLAGFLFHPWPGRGADQGWAAWIPGGLYLAAVAGDVIDGLVARATASQTLLGELLDTRIDALGILLACLLAIHYGQLQGFFITAGLAYYGLKIAVWLRQKSNSPCARPAPRRGARMLAAAMMVFLGWALLPVSDPEVLNAAGVFILIPFLAGFLLDWREVCRRERLNHVL